MKAPIQSSFAALLATVGLLFGGQSAAAAPAERVVNIGVILDDPVLEAAAGEALDPRRYRVIRGVDLRARATAEGIQPGLPPGTRALARSMGLSGIIGGVIRNQGDKISAFIVLSDGSSGEIVARARWTASNTPKLAAAIRRELWRKLGPSIRALLTVPGATTSPQPPVGVPPPPAPPSAVPPPAAAPVPGGPPPATAVPGTQGTAELPAPSLAGVDPAGEPLAAPPVATGAQPSAEPEGMAEGQGETEESEDPGARTARGRGLPLLQMAVGLRLYSRTLDYATDPQEALANYRAAVAPGAVLSAAAFPLRRWVPIGVEGTAESSARIASELSETRTYESRNIDLNGSLVVHLSSRWLLLKIAAGGGVHRFSFVATEKARSLPRPVPDVFYRYLRGGVGLRVMASPRFGVEAGAHYRYVLHPGEIRTSDWFPRDKAYAIEGSAGLVYRLTRQLETRAEAHLRRYQHTLNVKPGDARNSNSAIDQHISAGVSLAWLLGV